MCCNFQNFKSVLILHAIINFSKDNLILINFGIKKSRWVCGLMTSLYQCKFACVAPDFNYSHVDQVWHMLPVVLRYIVQFRNFFLMITNHSFYLTPLGAIVMRFLYHLTDFSPQPLADTKFFARYNDFSQFTYAYQLLVEKGIVFSCN